MTINNQALHTRPDTWGPDSLTWRPDRWMPSSDMKPNSSTADSESTIDSLSRGRGTFVPWADGPRSCPGRKFAQVEFVAVMAVLFRRHRVRPKLLDRETMEQAKKRVLGMVNDSAISAITLQMRRPKDVALVWSLGL